jgi:hypothetical protein
MPDHSKPLGGFEIIPGATNVELCHGEPGPLGTYNHASMIDYHNDTFFVAWKNGPLSEDKSGQRILFTQSIDGITWTKVDGSEANILFPNMTTSDQQAALFVGPPIHINGRQYVGASPGIPTGAAQGAQFCLWPDPLDVPGRNCGPAGHKQAKETLLMREIKPGIGNLGPIFWADKSNEVPTGWEKASAQHKFLTLREVDAQTQADVAQLYTPTPMDKLPCGPASTDGTLKCEACLGGCQLYDSIPAEMQANIGNERTHYIVPRTETDVILYRSGKLPHMYASVRANMSAGQAAWSMPVLTNIPNDESNMNTGTLPDGRIFLLNNAVFEPKNKWSAAGGRSGTGGDTGVGTLRFRDPVTIAVSKDGYVFDKAYAVMTCTNFTNGAGPSTCTPRTSGGGKNPGPSYPQGLTVTDPAPKELQGLYVVATNNKEDVWLTKLDYSAF